MKKRFSISVPWCAFLAIFIAGCLYFWLAGGFPGLSDSGTKQYIICPEQIHLEDRQPGSEEIVTFYLVNLSKKEISVVGEDSSCSCAFSEKFPITAPPKEAAEIKMRVRFPRDEPTYDQYVSFMVAGAKYLEMAPVRITASVAVPLDPAAESESETDPQDAAVPGEESSDEPVEQKLPEEESSS
ncbi:MAG: hypothetical protein IKE69_01910 [Thermoguttaceae bacterium]|nr:hypothetical protein [Thermoguttaceae bacterium]